MDMLLGVLAFAAFVLAQVAAVVAVHAGRERRQLHPFDATRLGNPAKQRQQRESALRKHAKALGFVLHPIQPEPVS